MFIQFSRFFNQKKRSKIFKLAVLTKKKLKKHHSDMMLFSKKFLHFFFL